MIPCYNKKLYGTKIPKARAGIALKEALLII